jgi:hypothetical protein
MDYCHPCRRHLNGALACAGCGTPAEELRRHDPSAPAAAPVYELDGVSEPTGHRRARREAPARRRAAGARRAPKRRGRKVLFGTFGLVLAAGALSLAELAIENPGDDGAATTVKEETPPETEETLEPTAPDETPQGPDPVTEPTASASTSARPTVTGAGTGSGDGGGSGDGKPTATRPVGPGPSSSPSDDDPSGSASPAPSGEPPGPSSAEPPPPSQQPDPEPSPKQTCNRFLWWCI